MNEEDESPRTHFQGKFFSTGRSYKNKTLLFKKKQKSTLFIERYKQKNMHIKSET